MKTGNNLPVDSQQKAAENNISKKISEKMLSFLKYHIWRILPVFVAVLVGIMICCGKRLGAELNVQNAKEHKCKGLGCECGNVVGLMAPLFKRPTTTNVWK